MKNPIITLVTLAVSATFMICGCKSPTVIDSTYTRSNFEVTCLDSNLDGTMTVRAFGKGKDKTQAMEQARKNAVRAIIFKGITTGAGDFDKRPLLTEVNAEEKYESYFNNFFKDGGEYQNFTSLEDEKFSEGKSKSSRIKAADTTQENWGVVIRVDRAGLKNKLIADSIIKK